MARRVLVVGCSGETRALRGAAVGGEMTMVAPACYPVAGKGIDPFTCTGGGLGATWEPLSCVMWRLRRGSAARDSQGLFPAARRDSGAFPVRFLARPGGDLGCP